MKKITFIAALFASVASFAQIASTSFEEPAVGLEQYEDTGDAMVAHDLVNNDGQAIIDFTATATEIGYDARYEPYDEPGVGLTDGDFVGVTDFRPSDGMDPVDFTDGTQGYQISDVDGNYILEFDEIDFTGIATPSVSIDYFISVTGYEGDGTENASGSDRLRIYLRDITNSTEIDIFNSTGSDINDLMVEGAWITGTPETPVLTGTTVQLVIEARTNAGGEAFFFDNVQFTGSLGTDDAIANQFSVYPNPANGSFVNINSTVAGDLNVAVYDVLGKQVINSVVTNQRLDISALTSGVYVVQITQDNATATKKLVVR